MYIFAPDNLYYSEKRCSSTVQIRHIRHHTPKQDKKSKTFTKISLLIKDLSLFTTFNSRKHKSDYVSAIFQTVLIENNTEHDFHCQTRIILLNIANLLKAILI